jgi:RNA polymerase sigma-70 factor (ECF subfamily)
MEAKYPHNLEQTLAPLVARAQAGDKAAFADLYRDNYRRVYALCVRLAGDRHLAEELTQEAFIRAWRQLHTYRCEARFSTWLHRVAVNVVLGEQRKAGWRISRLFSGHDAIPDTPERSSPVDTVDLERAIGQLPHRARQVFVLIDVEGFTHDEAARMLGIAAGTSKAQLFRARKLLRGMLS